MYSNLLKTGPPNNELDLGSVMEREQVDQQNLQLNTNFRTSHD